MDEGQHLNSIGSDDKVSTKNLKGIAEISINIALVVCVAYTAYLFLYKGSFIENMISEALTVTEALKASCPKDSLGSLPDRKIENSQQPLLDFQLKSL